MRRYDKIMIGAGLYGLYAALLSGRKGQHVLVLEKESAPFTRATYVNQARVHMGYHYPRSLATAVASAGYFSRFCSDFSFCIHDSFDQVYALSKNFSWTDANQFKAFCEHAGIPCEEIPTDRYFQKNMCDGAFLTKEYTYDAMELRDYLLEKCASLPNVELRYNASPSSITRTGSTYCVCLADNTEYETAFLLNATYASVNEIISMIFPTELFRIKYELCEIILCEAGSKLKNTGITVMDGPFFSIMPFGHTKLHSLTSVTFTPHAVSFEEVPTFPCQKTRLDPALSCSANSLGNCHLCPAHPKSAWPYMSRLAEKYLLPEYEYHYKQSLFSMKPILLSSEVDDSRPTAIRMHSGQKKGEPVFLSVLSGKINTGYDLDAYLAD